MLCYRHCLGFCLTMLAASGCANQPRPFFPPGGDSGGDSAGGDNLTPSDDSPGAPILDGPPGTRYPCAVTTAPAVLFGESFDAYGTTALAPLGADFAFARGRSATMSLYDLSVTRVLASGAAGTDLLTRSGDENSVYPALAATAAGVAVVWVEEDDLWFAELDTTGALAVAPVTISALASLSAMGETRLVTVASGYGLLFVGGGAVRFVRLGSDGQVTGSMQSLGSATYGITHLALVSVAAGFVAAWQESEPAGTEVFIVALDDAGAPHAAAQRVGRPAGDGYSSAHPALARAGGRVVAAWAEHWSSADFRNPQAHGIIRVAGFDALGNAATPVRVLQAPVTHVENVAPDLVSLGDDVGLVWSQGSIIYICAGCVPDHGLRFVALDGTDLGVQSPVLTLPATGGGGSLDAALAAHGLGLLVTFDIWFHVSAWIGAAAVSCE